MVPSVNSSNFHKLTECAMMGSAETHNIKDHFARLKFQGDGERSIVYLSPESKPEKLLFKLCTFTSEGKNTQRDYSKIKLKKSGEIKIKEKKFSSFEDFFKTYHPISSPNLLQLESLHEYKHFSHVWGLEGGIELGDGLFFRRTGWFTERAAKTLLDELNGIDLPKFCTTDNIFGYAKIKTAMTKALNMVVLLRNLRHQKDFDHAGRELIKFIETGKPVLIPSGYKKHAMYISYHNGYLAFTNKGGKHPNNQSGTYYFHVDESTLKGRLEDTDFVKKLLGKCSKEEYRLFQPFEPESGVDGGSFGGQMSEELDLKFVGFDPKQSQKVGNCTYANCIAAMHVIATFKIISMIPLTEGESVIDRMNLFKLDYKELTFAVRLSVLEKAVEKFGVNYQPFNRDAAFVYQKIHGKLENYQATKKFKGEEKEIEQMCHHYSETIKNLLKEHKVLNESQMEMMDYLRTVPRRMDYNTRQAEKKLKSKSIGTFFIRRSKTYGGVVMSFVDMNRDVQHLLIEKIPIANTEVAKAELKRDSNLRFHVRYSKTSRGLVLAQLVDGKFQENCMSF